MFERKADPFGAVVPDSFRRSLIVLVPEASFIESPREETRGSGFYREIPLGACDEIGLSVDRIVTCVMVVWAVSIFVGMSYLAAVI